MLFFRFVNWKVESETKSIVFYYFFFFAFEIFCWDINEEKEITMSHNDFIRAIEDDEISITLGGMNQTGSEPDQIDWFSIFIILLGICIIIINM